MSEPTAYTAEEARKTFLDILRAKARYWATIPVEDEDDRLYRCEGLIHSILSIIDGVSDFPAFDLVLRPHPDDKAFHIDEGDRWYEDGTTINGDVYLHELFFGRKSP